MRISNEGAARIDPPAIALILSLLKDEGGPAAIATYPTLNTSILAAP